MTIQLRPVRSRAILQIAGTSDERPAATDPVGRLIRVALVLHLLPALVAVLVIGATGMLVLAVSRLVVPGGGATGPGCR